MYILKNSKQLWDKQVDAFEYAIKKIVNKYEIIVLEDDQITSKVLQHI